MSHFQFNNSYTSNDGLIMVNLLKPLLAEKLIDKSENNIHLIHSNSFLDWYRYTAAICACFNGKELIDN